MARRKAVSRYVGSACARSRNRTEDRPLRVDQTIADWLAFGVGYVWVIDPETMESILHTAAGRVPVPDGVLRIPGTSIEIPLLKLDED